MREYINLMENDQQKGIMNDLLSFPRNNLLRLYVEGFNDREVMEYWLKVDADALPETPEIAREWLMANTEESSHSLAEMILDNMDEEEIRAHMDEDKKDPYEDTHNEMDEDMDEFGYDEEAEMDRESMVQAQIEDVLVRTNALMDEIGNEQPTAEQEDIINANADEITRLEKSLED